MLVAGSKQQAFVGLNSVSGIETQMPAFGVA
jgi:hypothetical protein